MRTLLGLKAAAPQKATEQLSVPLGCALRLMDLFCKSRARKFPIRSSKSIAPCAWDSIGNSGRLSCGMRPASEATVARMKKEGRTGGGERRELLASGQNTWYADDPKTASGRRFLGPRRRSKSRPLQVPAGVWSVTVAKKSSGVVKKNSGASLVDLGDGVGLHRIPLENEFAGRGHHLG